MSNQEFDETFLPIAVGTSHSPRLQPVEKEATIRLAGLEPRSFVAGPGVRSVIWVAGCHRRCPGCSQPEYHSFSVGKDVSVDGLWERIRETADIEGVTFSGGEPFEQVKPLAELGRRVHQAGMSVVCYSGYRLEALQSDVSRFGDLLDQVDLLIDGEFRFEAKGNYRWRGSSNQRLLCLTDKIILPPEEAVSEMQITLHERGNGVSLSGIWPQGLIKELMLGLGKLGFSLERDTSDLSDK